MAMIHRSKNGVNAIGGKKMKQMQLLPGPATLASIESLAIPLATGILFQVAFAGDQKLFQDHDNISGIATLSLRYGPVFHEGFDIQIWRVITMPGTEDRLLLLRRSRLVAPGQLNANMSFLFVFENVELQHDTFHSRHVSLRYVLRVFNEDFGLNEIEFLVGNGIVGFPLGWPGQPIMLRLDFLDSESDAESYFEVRFARNIFRLDEQVSGHVEFLFDDQSFTGVRLESFSRGWSLC